MAHPITFGLSCVLVVCWAAAGPFCHYSAEWQLVINTSTTILTFLMVFLIQNAQNREAKAMQLKMDELLRAVKQARNEMIQIENLSEEDLFKYEQEFARLRARSSHKNPGTSLPPDAQ